MSRSPKLPLTWRELNVLTDLFAAIIHSPNQVWANSLIFDFYHLTWIAKETGLSLNARRPDRTPAGKRKKPGTKLESGKPTWQPVTLGKTSRRFEAISSRCFE